MTESTSFRQLFAPFKPDCGTVQICPVFTLYNK